MAMTFKVDMDLQATIRKLGMEDRGRVQKYIDSEVMRMCDKYVPMDTGALKNSVQLNTSIGSGKVVWSAPYARRWYYRPAEFQGAPIRGNYWGQRALQNGGKENLLQGVKAIINNK